MFQNWSWEWKVHKMSNTVGVRPTSMHITLKCRNTQAKFPERKNHDDIKLVSNNTTQTKGWLQSYELLLFLAYIFTAAKWNKMWGWKRTFHIYKAQQTWYTMSELFLRKLIEDISPEWECKPRKGTWTYTQEIQFRWNTMGGWLWR